MAIFHGTTIPAGASGDPEFTGSGESLRFNSGTNTFLNHTAANIQPTSPYTISCWVKRSKLGTGQYIYRFNSADSLYFNTSDQLGLERRPTSFTTTKKFRDVSSWYHIVVKSTTSAVTLYVNGVQEHTASGTANPYTAGRLDIGCANGNTQYFDGYISQFHYVQGQSLGPESFGEEGTYGEWKVKEYTGGHGSTGFYLPFNNSGTIHTITANGDAQHSTTEKKMGASSMKFDGSGDYLQIPDHNDFKFDGDYTVECWFNMSSASGGCFFSKHQPGVANIGLFINRATTGAIRWQDDKNSIYTEAGSGLNNGAWHHLALVRNGSGSGNLKLYIDGSLASTQSGSTAQTQSSNVAIGMYINNGDHYLNGYIDEFRISSTARYTANFTPSTSAFTSDSNTVLLIHSDTTNGSTTFVDSSGASSGLGTDTSGQNNHFTSNNLGSHDIVADRPLNNYCTWNPLEDNVHHVGYFGEGALEGAGKTSSYFHMGSVGTLYTNKKFYFEVYLKNQSNPDCFFGVAPDDYHPSASPSNDAVVNWPGKNFAGAALNCSYNVVTSDVSTSVSFTTTGSTGDIWGVAFDPATGKFWVHQNGTWFSSGNPSTGANPLATLSDLTNGSTPRLWTCAAGQYQLQSRMILNCGQDGTFNGNKSAGGYKDENDEGNFYYAVPTGFLALCENNLDEPTVKPTEHFSVTIRTGNNQQAVTGIGFQPDFIWSKTRNSGSHHHQLHDSLRGSAGGALHINSGMDENHGASLDSFDSDGFTIESGNLQGMNETGFNYATWAWKAATTASGTTSGSGTGKSYTSRYNTDAGFSMVRYGANGTAGHAIPHHLSKAPELIIIKNLDYNGTEWVVGTEQELASMNWNHVLYMDQAVAFSDWNVWNDTAPTSSVFTVSTAPSTNHNNQNLIAYCFHSVDGYSRIGNYIGNGNSNGTYVGTGFSPRWIIIKRLNGSYGYAMHDTVRDTMNPVTAAFKADDTEPETTINNGGGIDFLSNGFKIRDSGSGMNGSGDKYLYWAIADRPFKYTNAR